MAVGRTPLRAIIEKSSFRSSPEVTPSGTCDALVRSLPTFTEESLAWRYGATSFAIVTASRKLSRIAFGVCVSAAMSFLKRQTVEVRHSVFHYSKAIGLDRFIVGHGQIELVHQEDDPWQYKYPKASPFQKA